MMVLGSNLVLATLLLLVLFPNTGYSHACQPDQIVHQWQNRLHLSEWDIRASFATESEIGAEMLGDIEYHGSTRIAVIRILDPTELRGESGDEGAWRECQNRVLHELIHLMLHKLMPPVDTDDEERVVVDLTEAFLASRGYDDDEKTRETPGSAASSKRAGNVQRENMVRIPR